MTSKDSNFPLGPHFELRLAQDETDLQAAQRLRYEVFVQELGADGPLVDHENQREADAYDPFYDHLILTDTRRQEAGLDPVVGVYRLLRSSAADRAGGFYSQLEYDLEVLIKSGRPLLELGRSCVHRDYRGGAAMLHLWNGVARYIQEHEVEVLFGVASFHGTDVRALAHPLSLLADRHLAPSDLRVRARADHYQPMDLLPTAAIDRKRAMLETPSLIKAYLRLGGFVGEGAYVDHAFNTTDVCLILDVARMSARQKALYSAGDGNV